MPQGVALGYYALPFQGEKEIMKTYEQASLDLSPELSALEASLASLEPVTQPGSGEETKSVVLLRLLRKREESPPQLSGEKLIETIVKAGDREITLSLREYVKSARLIAGLYGAAVGVFVGLLFGIGFMWLIVNQPVREVYHVPYYVSDIK